MQDKWYGHRTHKGEKVGDPDEWIRWDYSLAAALQIIEDSTDRHGLLAWEIEPPYIEVEAIKRIDKFQAAVDSRTSGKKYKPEQGEYFVPRILPRAGRKPPLYSEFLEERRKEFEKEAES